MLSLRSIEFTVEACSGDFCYRSNCVSVLASGFEFYFELNYDNVVCAVAIKLSSMNVTFTSDNKRLHNKLSTISLVEETKK